MNDMQYRCGQCGHTWKASDYCQEGDSVDMKFNDYTEDELDYIDGHNCPQCRSRDIYGKDI